MSEGGGGGGGNIPSHPHGSAPLGFSGRVSDLASLAHGNHHPTCGSLSGGCGSLGTHHCGSFATGGCNSLSGTCGSFSGGSASSTPGGHFPVHHHHNLHFPGGSPCGKVSPFREPMDPSSSASLLHHRRSRETPSPNLMNQVNLMNTSSTSLNTSSMNQSNSSLVHCINNANNGSNTSLTSTSSVPMSPSSPDLMNPAESATMIKRLQLENRTLKMEVEALKLRVKSLIEDKRHLMEASVSIQARAEQEEEYISNTLLKKIQVRYPSNFATFLIVYSCFPMTRFWRKRRRHWPWTTNKRRNAWRMIWAENWTNFAKRSTNLRTRLKSQGSDPVLRLWMSDTRQFIIRRHDTICWLIKVSVLIAYAS